MLTWAQRRTWYVCMWGAEGILSDKKEKENMSACPCEGLGGVWGMSVGEEERKRPVPTLSALIRRNLGAQWVRRRAQVSFPKPPGGHPRLWDVCSDTPKCPEEHQGRYLMVPAMEETEPIAAGCRQTSKSRSDVRFGATSQWTAQHYSENIQCAQVLTAIASRTSRDPREQGRYHCIPSTNPESSPRSPCWS